MMLTREQAMRAFKSASKILGEALAVVSVIHDIDPRVLEENERVFVLEVCSLLEEVADQLRTKLAGGRQ